MLKSQSKPKKKRKTKSKVFLTAVEAVLATTLILLIGLIFFRYEFADRIPPHVQVGLFPLGGLQISQLEQAMHAYEQEFNATKVTIQFRGGESTHTFQELGIELQKEKTAQKIASLAGGVTWVSHSRVVPEVIFHDPIALSLLQRDFADRMTIPQNPALAIDAQNRIQVLPSKGGEHIDMISLDRDITEAMTSSIHPVVSASTIHAISTVTQDHMENLRLFAEELMKSGFHLTAFDQTFDIPGKVVASMMVFPVSVSPVVQFEEEKLRKYIADHIAPSIEQEPVNARFQIEDGKVSQFALPQDGRTLQMDQSIQAIQRALSIRTQSASLAMEIVHPIVSDTDDSEKLGITTLLAKGETDFRGSPKNRVHNVEVGAARFNGILIAPQEEFSFNKILGPVDKAAGYLPELVIKNHVTTPEFGGGLCQVSTTAFRAAIFSGMKITARRNHAYAVRYYGTPGFDATIYPPYTDFRFLNNTPGYILIQTKIEGTKLSFEFWGTSDDRSVVVDGPHPYNRQPDGAVKSVLKQTVTKENGEVLIEDTFYSNYKSPNLFPHT